MLPALIAVAVLILVSSSRSYLKDLRAYCTEFFLDEDSRVKVLIPALGGMTGYMRLFLYYPLMFGLSSIALTSGGADLLGKCHVVPGAA